MHSWTGVEPASTLRLAARTLLGILAAALLVSPPSAAGAQSLQATPLNWPSLLPAPPVPSSEVKASEETSGSFLKGRFLLGVSSSRALTPDEALGSEWNFSPVIRNTPRRLGWGPSFGLNWFHGHITVPVNGQATKIGEVKVRPVMGGVGYSLGSGRLRTTFGLVGGYAFTDAKVTAALPAGTTASIDIGNAWVVRPNVGLTYALTRRLALIGSVGYVYTNPSITIDVAEENQAPRRISGSFRSDYVNVAVGTAISIF